MQQACAAVGLDGSRWCVAMTPERPRNPQEKIYCRTHAHDSKYRPSGRKERWSGHWFRPSVEIRWPWDGNVASPTRPTL